MNIKMDTILAGLLAIAFFLPWVGMGPFNMSGYGITQMGSDMGDSGVVILYLIPIMAIIFIVMSLRGKSNRMLQILTGAVPLAIFAYMVMKAGNDMGGGMGGSIFEVLGIGAYLTVLPALALIGMGIASGRSAK